METDKPTTSESSEDNIRNRILAHIDELLDAHWRQIVEIRDQEESEVSIGFNIHVNASGTRPIVKTKIRYAKTFTDECEEVLKDPNQDELPIQ